MRRPHLPRFSVIPSLFRLSSVATALLLATGAQAQTSFTFTKIADTSTAAPGGSGNFTNLIEAFSGEGMVGYFAASSGVTRGLYVAEIAGNGSVTHTKIADYSTLAPDGSQNFSDLQLGRGGILNGTVYFHGAYNNASGTWAGIYGFDTATDTLTRVTSRGLAYPNYSGTVNGVGYVISRGDNLTIASSRTNPAPTPGAHGFLRYDGTTLAAVLDSSTTTGAQPASVGPYATNGSQIALRETGIFHSFTAGGVQTTRTMTDVLVPNRAFNFGTNLSNLALTDNELFFVSSTEGVQGLYRMNADLSGPVSLVADTSTLFSPEFGTFNFFGAVSANSDSVAFLANSSNGTRGLFLYHAGEISKIIDNSAPLDGNLISNFTFTETALSEEGFAFRVSYSGGSAIYYTSLSAIPEPSTWAALLGAGALGYAWLRRRRK